MGIPSCSLDTLSANFVAEALCTQRCFIVRNAVVQAQSEAGYAAAKRIFPDKKRLAGLSFAPKDQFGYTPPGIESVHGKNPDPDRHSFDYRPRMGLDVMEDIPLEQLYARLVRFGTAILEFVCPLAKLVCHDATHVLRITEYLNKRIDPERILFPAHYDFGFLTLFVGNGAPGLQVEIEGAWIDAVLNVGDVLVGPGSAFRLYEPTYKPLRHRVVASSLNRVSLAAFIEPNSSFLVPGGKETFGKRLERLQTETRK